MNVGTPELQVLSRTSRDSRVLIALLVLALCSCGKNGAPREVPGGDPLAAHKGKVQVLLLGMEGCPGTASATPFLTKYAKEKQKGLAVVRVDVPVQAGEPVRKPASLDPQLNYVADESRAVAEKLDFFFYPTLYILDKDGVVRYHGEAEEKEVRKMVSEILTEDPASPKKMYTPPLLEIGTTITDFTGTTTDGKTTSLKKLKGETATFLLFGATTCPFSVQAAEALPKLSKEFEAKGVGFAIVNFGQPADEIRSVYNEKAAGLTVIVDADSTISKQTFKVPAVPFFCLLDKDLKVLERKPFAVAVARAAVGKKFGIRPEPLPAKGAG